jgi:hypothetical protein
MPRAPHDDLLATDFGVEALHEAAFERALSTSAWPAPADGYALVDWLLAHEKDPDVARVLARARIRVRYRGPARTRVAFVGRERLHLADGEKAARDLERGLVRALGERGFPAHARVIHSGNEERAHFAIDLPSRWTRVTTGAGDRPLAFRALPARITYAPGELDVTAAHPVHASILVEEAARAWFGDARFFKPARMIALRPFQRGRTAFKIPAELRGAILRVRMIDCIWDSGRAVTLYFAGDDCPREMKKLGLHIEGGELLATTLRFDFLPAAGAPSAPRQVDVTLRAPNELSFSEPGREEIIRAYLAGKRVITRKRPLVDLWTLDPWTPSDAAARAFFGDAFDELVAERVLVEAVSRAVVHPDHPHAGRTLIAFPIDGEPGSFYGATDGTRIPARTLSAQDLVSWRVDMRALGKRVARGLGLEGRVGVFERRGVIDLGALAIGATQARFFFLSRMPIDPKALAERLRLRAMPGHAVLLVPAGRKSRTGLPEVEVARAHGPYDGVVGAAARALGLAKEVSPILLAPAGTRVVVHLASRRVWFDGVLIHPLREQSYKMVEILAKLGGASIGKKDLAEQISLANLDGAAAQAKHGLKLAILASFEREGRPVPADAEKIVETVRRGEVRIGVPVFVA